MSNSNLKTVTKYDPCRHCDKPDWCYRLDDVEVCKRDKIADGWQATTKTDAQDSVYLRAVITKAERPWGKTFNHEYQYFDSERTATVTRKYLADKSGKDCKMQSGTKQSELMPYKWELACNAYEIFAVEGEMQVDDLIERGLSATSCRVWTNKQASLYTGKTIVILPDCDLPGIKKATETAALLTKHGATVKYCYLPKIGNWKYLPESGGLDSYDYFGRGGTVEELRSYIVDSPIEIESDHTEAELDAEYLATLTEYAKPQRGLLPEFVEIAITELASKMGLESELYFADLLAVAGSLIPIGTSLLIDSGTDYQCPPIFWVGTVGETGSMKSPKLKATLKPLFKLQANEEMRYKEAVENWQAENEAKKPEEPELPKPVCRDYYLSDYTIEYISKTISNQESQGFSICMDELAAFFQSFDQYKNGKGSERAKFLSLYDGGAWKVNRKGDENRVFAEQTGISLLGGIQPSVLQKIMTNDSSPEDGLWARFSWVRLPLTKAPVPSGDKYLLGDVLLELYQSLEKTPKATYTFSIQAQQLWAEWHEEMETIKLTEASPILRAIYPKMKERAGRIALISHCIRHQDGLTPQVSVETLQRAISFTKWLIAQSKELYAEFGIGDNPEMARVLKFINRFKKCGELSAQQVRSWWSAKEKPPIQEIRNFMLKVVNLGYAQATGDPNKSDYRISISKKT